MGLSYPKLKKSSFREELPKPDKQKSHVFFFVGIEIFFFKIFYTFPIDKILLK